LIPLFLPPFVEAKLVLWLLFSLFLSLSECFYFLLYFFLFSSLYFFLSFHIRKVRLFPTRVVYASVATAQLGAAMAGLSRLSKIGGLEPKPSRPKWFWLWLGSAQLRLKPWLESKNGLLLRQSVCTIRKGTYSCETHNLVCSQSSSIKPGYLLACRC